MTKKERELRAQLAQVTNEARQLADENKMAEAKAKAEEAKELKQQIDLLIELEDIENSAGREVPKGEEKDKQEEEEQYKAAICKVIRGKALSAQETSLLETRAAMSEGSAADGGLIVPQDIQTRINERKRALIDLTRYISVEPVGTNTGSRVYEKLATMTPLTNLTPEVVTDIADMGNPQFETITYAIKDYAGWMPLSNTLLQDSDQAIMTYLEKWIAKKSVVTRNSLILAIIGDLTPTAFEDWKAIKKALNVTLDPLFAANAKIYTNQDGYQLMDTWTDSQNRPLLKPDVTQPGSNTLFGKQIVVLPNSQMPTTGTTTKKAKVIVGDLAENMVMFERQGHLIASTNIGGTAFRRNTTEVRVIEREDIKTVESAAITLGELDVTSI